MEKPSPIALFVSIIAVNLLLKFMPNVIYAQILKQDFGARSAGMAHSNSSLADEWSLFNNVGGISGIENTTVLFGYNMLTDIEGFNQVGAGFSHPLKIGVIGASVLFFGDKLYNEQQASLSIGNKIGFVRLGLRANYNQLRIDQYGSAATVSLDFGGIVEIIPKLNIGTYISNFTLSSVKTDHPNQLPVVMKLGISYKPADKIILNVDLVKDIEFDPEIRSALEYKIIEKLALRTGIQTDPFQYFFGLGFRIGKFQLDYAFAEQEHVGYSHNTSISFRFN